MGRKGGTPIDAERLRRRMHEMGVNQTQLATHVGVAKSQVSGWLTGAAPTTENLSRLADVLGVTVAYLVGGEPGGAVVPRHMTHAVVPPPQLPPEAMTPEQLMAFNIKRFREEAGLTQEQFAALLRLSKEAISAWESQRNEPAVRNLREMAAALGRPMQDFFNPNPPPPQIQRREPPAVSFKIVRKGITDEERQLASEMLGQFSEEFWTKLQEEKQRRDRERHERHKGGKK